MSPAMPARVKPLFLGAALVALALPAVAQESILPPGFGNEASPPAPATSPPVSTATPTVSTPVSGEQLTVSDELEPGEELPPPRPLIEIPESSRRNPALVGTVEPARLGLGAAPWGNASGAFLGTLMRRMDTPLASRWAHIALRNALISRTYAPRNINPADWTAE